MNVQYLGASILLLDVIYFIIKTYRFKKQNVKFAQMIKTKPEASKKFWFAALYLYIAPPLLSPCGPWVYAFIIFCCLRIFTMAAFRNTSSGQMSWLSGVKGSQERLFFSSGMEPFQSRRVGSQSLDPQMLFLDILSQKMRFLFPLKWRSHLKAKPEINKAWPHFQVLIFPCSLGPRSHLFYLLFFFQSQSDFIAYFLPHTPSLPHFGTSV